jgi:hypothetical protein
MKMPLRKVSFLLLLTVSPGLSSAIAFGRRSKNHQRAFDFNDRAWQVPFS